MSKSNLYKALTVAAKLANAIDDDKVPSQAILEESLDVMLDLITQIKGHQNEQATQKASTVTVSTTAPAWTSLHATGHANLGYTIRGS